MFTSRFRSSTFPHDATAEDLVVDQTSSGWWEVRRGDSIRVSSHPHEQHALEAAKKRAALSRVRVLWRKNGREVLLADYRPGGA